MPRVVEGNGDPVEVFRVSCHEREVLMHGCCCDCGVGEGDGFACNLMLACNLAGEFCDRFGDGDNAFAEPRPDDIVKPALKHLPTRGVGMAGDAIDDFGDGHDAHEEIALRDRPDPPGDFPVWIGLVQF